MEVKKVRLHTCQQRIEGYIERDCECRKYVADQEVSELTDNGQADYVIDSFKTVTVEEICPICQSVDNLKKSCNLCNKTGKIDQTRVVFTYGKDIYMCSVLKTPRTATIEAKHILYAYIKKDKDAIRRIEMYHSMNQTSLAQLGASIIDSRTRQVVFEGTPEPEDDPKKGTGRRYDYGRPI